MLRKLTIAILFGGKSAEHEVSIRSAKNVYNALVKTYKVILIGIDKKGNWYISEGLSLLDEGVIKEKNGYEQVSLVKINNRCSVFSLVKNKEISDVDVVFPVLHGPFGEDGSIQGFLKVLDVPFVGPGVLGSAVGMDKDIAKRLLKGARILTAKCLVFTRNDTLSFNTVKNKLGLPLFVKPANLGSSVGVNKVKTENEFLHAIKEAFQYDNKILIEENISGREIECSVLGNKKPKASIVGEIIPNHDFYDYSAKYIDDNGADLKIPAVIPLKTLRTVQKLACKTFKVLELEGMARIDFFLSKQGKLYVNEVNTIPGFTNISMYPKLWKKSGVTSEKLVQKLVELAMERYTEEGKLKITY